MSARESTLLESFACSGDMYAGVPKTDAAIVIIVSCSSVDLAMPRSASFADPSAANMMLSGLMSR